MSDEVFKIKVDDSEIKSALKGFEALKKLKKKFDSAKKSEKNRRKGGRQKL